MKQIYIPFTPATSRVRKRLTAVWGVLSLLALGFILISGCNAPAVDEWEFVAELVGQAPVLSWLWAQHNEHRLPLSKLIYLGQFRLTHDFRSGMLLQVGMLSVLSLGLMKLAARLRSYPHWTDAFFPISLLHLGHWENFLLGYQICFTLFTILVTGLIVIALQATRQTAFGTGIFAAGLAFLVALTGGFGLPILFTSISWLVYLAFVLWRDQKKRRSMCLLFLAGLGSIYPWLYFSHFHRPENIPASTDPVAIALVSGQVLGMAFGIGFSAIWWAVLIGEVVMVSATINLLIRQARDANLLPASVGLIAIVLGLCGIALAIGIGRAGFGSEMGLWSRYSLLIWPLLCATYLTWAKAGRGQATPTGLVKWIPLTLCVCAVLAFPTNTGAGLYTANRIVSRDVAFQQDLRNGLPDAELIAKHFPGSRNEGQEFRAVWGIPMLREAGMSIFAVGEFRGGHSPLWKVGALAVAVTFALIARWLWHLGMAIQAERARELFRLQHERFEEQLIQAGNNSGRPRGLNWIRCQITGAAVMVRDTTTDSIVALVPVMVEFQPLEDSDMADNPAAREPRIATAVFLYERGTWYTTGRVVFNHTPEETIATFSPRFRIIQHGEH